MTDSSAHRLTRASYNYCPRCGIELTNDEATFALESDHPTPPFCFPCFADIFAELRQAVVDGSQPLTDDRSRTAGPVTERQTS